jgi:hypothetical protein
LHEAVEVFIGEVLFGAKEDTKNEVTLRRALKSFLLDMFEKDFVFFG